MYLKLKTKHLYVERLSTEHYCRPFCTTCWSPIGSASETGHIWIVGLLTINIIPLLTLHGNVRRTFRWVLAKLEDGNGRIVRYRFSYTRGSTFPPRVVARDTLREGVTMGTRYVETIEAGWSPQAAVIYDMICYDMI